MRALGTGGGSSARDPIKIGICAHDRCLSSAVRGQGGQPFNGPKDWCIRRWTDGHRQCCIASDKAERVSVVRRTFVKQTVKIDLAGCRIALNGSVL
jgi:hypothetical protein